jgi:hypothetical protein
VGEDFRVGLEVLSQGQRQTMRSTPAATAASLAQMARPERVYAADGAAVGLCPGSGGITKLTSSASAKARNRA